MAGSLIGNDTRRCWGLTNNLRRCGRLGNWNFFCKDHRLQPLVWLVFVVCTVGGGLASIQSAWLPRLWGTGQQSAVVGVPTRDNTVVDGREKITKEITVDKPSAPFVKHAATVEGHAKKSVTNSLDSTAPSKTSNLREEGLALSKEILSFLDERQQANTRVQGPPFYGTGESKTNDDQTPQDMKQTRALFAERFEARIADLHDEFSRIGLQDSRLEGSYKYLPNIVGNVDVAIQRIAESIRKLALLCPPRGLYKDVSDGRLAEIAIEEANRMDAMTGKAMRELPLTRTPDAIRFFFFSEFQQCCLNQVEYLRAELLNRLGPSEFDSREMDAFNGFNGLTEIDKTPRGSLATVLDYSPHFREIADKLKMKSAITIAAKPQ